MNAPPDKRPYFLDMTPQQVQSFIVEGGGQKFRAAQLAQWVYKHGVMDTAIMKNVPACIREMFDFSRCDVARKQQGKDGTIKLLLRYADGETVEAVIMPLAHRVTACVSTQVGCAMGCKFCASQLDGFKRNLTSGEILEQVLQLQIAAETKVTNVVFMGMGEPLANYDATIAAVRGLIDPDRFGLSARKITVSTIGLPDQIRRLGREDIPITLAISLHAPADDLRSRIIPYAKNVAISEIMQAAEEFYSRRKREITLEYVLLDGVNNDLQHAEQLSKIAHRLRCNVNLIIYNKVSDSGFRGPTRESAEHFQLLLRNKGVNATLRISRGSDIDSACGQLRRKSS